MKARVLGWCVECGGPARRLSVAVPDGRHLSCDDCRTVFYCGYGLSRLGGVRRRIAHRLGIRRKMKSQAGSWW